MRISFEPEKIQKAKKEIEKMFITISPDKFNEKARKQFGRKYAREHKINASAIYCKHEPSRRRKYE